MAGLRQRSYLYKTYEEVYNTKVVTVSKAEKYLWWIYNLKMPQDQAKPAVSFNIMNAMVAAI